MHKNTIKYKNAIKIMSMKKSSCNCTDIVNTKALHLLIRILIHPKLPIQDVPMFKCFHLSRTFDPHWLLVVRVVKEGKGTPTKFPTNSAMSKLDISAWAMLCNGQRLIILHSGRTWSMNLFSFYIPTFSLNMLAFSPEKETFADLNPLWSLRFHSPSTEINTD